MGKIVKRILVFIGLVFLSCLIAMAVSVLITADLAAGAQISVVSTLMSFLPLACIIGAVYVAFIRPYKKDKETAAKKKQQREQEIKNLKEMPITDLLKLNELDHHCELFEKHEIGNVEIAVDLTDSDLLSMGIDTLGERKKLLKLFSEKKASFSNKEDAGRRNGTRQTNNSGINKPVLIFAGALVLAVIGLLTVLVLKPENSTSTAAASSTDNANTYSANPLAFTTWRSANFRIDFDENTYTTERINNRYGTTPLQLTPRPYTVDGNTVTLENLLEMPLGSPMTRQGGSLISRTGERFTQE